MVGGVDVVDRATVKSNMTHLSLSMNVLVCLITLMIKLVVGDIPFNTDLVLLSGRGCEHIPLWVELRSYFRWFWYRHLLSPLLRFKIPSFECSINHFDIRIDGNRIQNILTRTNRCLINRDDLGGRKKSWSVLPLSWEGFRPSGEERSVFRLGSIELLLVWFRYLWVLLIYSWEIALRWTQIVEWSDYWVLSPNLHLRGLGESSVNDLCGILATSFTLVQLFWIFLIWYLLVLN